MWDSIRSVARGLPLVTAVMLALYGCASNRGGVDPRSLPDADVPRGAARTSATAGDSRRPLSSAHPTVVNAGSAPGPGGQRTFADFGHADRIVFVCDASGSMIDTFGFLKGELAKAISAVQPSQSFGVVIFTDNGAKVFDRDRLQPADGPAKRRALAFMDQVPTTGTSEPIAALRAAFGLHPDLIYFLTDGDLPNGKAALDEFRRLDPGHNVRVNTIAFIGPNGDLDPASADVLQTVADETGGEFRLVQTAVLDDGPRR